MAKKKHLKRILSGISFYAFLFGGIAGAETLDEALTYTYIANPEILSQRAYLNSVREKITQSQSGYKPSIVGQASYGYEYERAQNSPFFQEKESKPVTYGVTAVQPIFSGFATSSSVKAAKELFEAKSASLKETEQSTLMNAVTAYTNVIRALAVLKLNQNNEIVLQRQLEYTQDRFRVGELTKTDVAQAQARHAASVSGRITAEGDLKIAYAGYRKAIGKLPDRIYEPEVPAAKIPPTLQDVLELALKNNPAVQAAEKQAQSAKSSIEAEESGHYPTLELQAAYQNMRAGAHGSATVGGINIETGRLRDEDTTVKMVLKVPFYKAGETSSKVREAKYTAGQARINVNTVKRAVAQMTTQAWENYQSTQASLASLEQQVSASAMALEGVRYEEQAGERSILDVLNAEQELLNARVNVVSAKKNLIDAAYRLIAAMGMMTPSGLGLDLDRYRKATPAAESAKQVPAPQETTEPEKKEISEPEKQEAKEPETKELNEPEKQEDTSLQTTDAPSPQKNETAEPARTDVSEETAQPGNSDNDVTETAPEHNEDQKTQNEQEEANG